MIKKFTCEWRVEGQIITIRNAQKQLFPIMVMALCDCMETITVKRRNKNNHLVRQPIISMQKNVDDLLINY